MADITLYTTRFCPFCVRAKMLLDKLQEHYTEISVDGDPEQRQKMMELSGGYTVPQIFINQQAIGGCDELFSLHNSGKLKALLTQ